MKLAARARAGPWAGVLFGLVFSGFLVPILTVEHWLGLPGPIGPGDVAKVSLRRTAATTPHGLDAGDVVVARGDIVTAEALAVLPAYGPPGAPPPSTLVGAAVGFFFVGVLFCAFLRATPRGRLLRVQLTLLGLLVAFAAAGKLLLLLTPLAWLAAPTALAALVASAVVDRYAGFAVALAVALVAAALLPFDPSVAIVLAVEGIASVLTLGRPRRRRAFLLAGIVGGLAAGAAYLGLVHFYGGQVTSAELGAPLRSGLVGLLSGGPLGAVLALGLRTPVEALAGEIPRARLMELADLENPLLKRIATDAPGTWQHSLAMANLAEICANAIGANALLVRVGAYYHDLGKSLQPQYYIENLAAGQPSPHDALPPEMSADAIFAHVTEGVRLARANNLPTAIIDFMHMHHGDGLLEYFWSKCLEQGNPKNLHPQAFRYPGKKPQSRETAILAICDAVEAASRTLNKPDARAIETIVQRIVYGKLHNGQLDESSMTVAELRKLANTLVDTLKHAHHVRIEYPWQREERARQAAPTAKVTPVPPAEVTTTGAFVLDSADAPRPTKKTTSKS